ncbi:hypothetical protein NDR87_30050 [Nocardia sp. CDC159]|uniref:Uncharacterized protein n=1 Tax=Nocardia pulmonis TaxID=2951408 RepID=A0A9X2EE09_9NOCA|nr:MULTISPECIES: hypothetical protein [Nocardia]MCM6777735.1 hypothetical protein [Nocardia pulmonis]MCM6790620.1 hypothetical protein [Nocardia sp. CDC159]
MTSDIHDLLDALHRDPSPASRIVSKILDDVTSRAGWESAWEQFDPTTQTGIITTWTQIVRDTLHNEADTTVSPSGMVRVHVHPSGGDRALMASEVKVVVAALTQAFLDDPGTGRRRR